MLRTQQNDTVKNSDFPQKQYLHLQMSTKLISSLRIRCEYCRRVALDDCYGGSCTPVAANPFLSPIRIAYILIKLISSKMYVKYYIIANNYILYIYI